MSQIKVLGMALSAVVAAMAHGQTFNWQLNGDFGIQASGQFIVTGNQVTSLTGQVSDPTGGPYPITGLAAPGSGFQGSGDNAWPLTSAGVVMTVDVGSPLNVTIATPGNTFILTPPSNVILGINTSGGMWLGGEFTYTPVPEPSTYAAFAALGLAGFGVWRRSRR